MEKVTYLRFQQFIVTYQNQQVLKNIEKHSRIIYSSVVVNLAIVETLHSKEKLLNTEGVMSVVQPRDRIYSNKRR